MAKRTSKAPRKAALATKKTAAPRTRSLPKDPNGRAVTRHVRALTPYLSVGDAGAAIAWYRKVFGAKLPVEPMRAPDGKVLHAALLVGDSLLYLSDIFPGADVVDPARVGASVTLTYDRPNAGHVWARAVENGAKVTMPFEDRFWGDVYGKIIDPFGHSWALARRSKLGKKELAALREKAMAQFAG